MRFAPAIPLLLLSAPCFAQMISGNMAPNGGANQTNNPVAMFFEHRQSQTLADGTHINTVTHETFIRDSSGRTLVENQIGLPAMTNGQQMHTITVRDPVTSTIMSWQTGMPEGSLHQYNLIDENLLRHPPGSASGPDHVPPPVLRRAPAPTQPVPHPATRREDLGTQLVEGVPCAASRITTVYPIEFMGNDRPITTVTERCLSQEFGRTLMESTVDPRSGTRTITLQSISRVEPDSSIFQPPPDYVDSKTGVH